MYPCFVVEEILGMKENIGVIYDTSPQVDEVVEVLLGSLSLARQSARPVREVWGGWLCRYDVMMLVSAFWGDVFLPGEWHRFFEREGIDSFSGRTLVPVATSRPLVVSMAPVLRRLFRPVCVRVVWPAECFLFPKGILPRREMERELRGRSTSGCRYSVVAVGPTTVLIRPTGCRVVAIDR